MNILVKIPVALIALIFSVAIAISAYAGGGPFDYTNPDDVREHLPITEQYHFNSDVENLIKGMSASIRGDLIYVLNRFPNHHRALNSMAKLWRNYAEKHQVPPGEGLDPSETAEYWFERAIKFAPHDGVVRLLYGIHMHKMGKLDMALVHYMSAVQMMPDSADAHYDLGLLYVDLKDYASAKEQAEMAYKLGYPLPGLKNKLIKIGAWNTGSQQ